MLVADLDSLVDEALHRCDVLAACSETPGEITRTFLRPPMRRVHEHLREWMTAAGLDVRLDSIGNLIGRRSGATERVFAIGSHVDTVPNAGKYDGVLGVVLGVAAMQHLRTHKFRKTADVIAFSEEEGVRFRTPYLGSRAVCGRIDSQLLTQCDAAGLSMAHAIREFGLNPDSLALAAYPPSEPAAYFEAHIEQGPVLESLAAPLGVVTAIIGQSRFVLTFIGHAGHAGTQPMAMRRDALAAAAEWILAVETLAKSTDGLRATVGRIEVEPGATNVVPGLARLTLDVRHEDNGIRCQAVNRLLAEARAIAQQRSLEFEVAPTLDESSTPCDGGMIDRLAAAVANSGTPVHRLVSGAGHDAVVMATRCPVAMLFIRSPGGISHHPDERVERADVRAALDVMIRFLISELELE